MIRIQLINEGQVVKQITSRVHEGVVLEQIKRYTDPFDTIQILEGELSEDAKSILQHVSRKIIPAAMAAGIAMSGAGAHAQGGANPHYPGMDRSIGQHISDIVSPNYKELVRQRDYERDTRRREWDAQQGEIRNARVSAARDGGRQAVGATHQKVYDQSKVSQDGRFFIIYGMDDRVTRIPVKGTEYMPADSQRLAHYITSAGSVFYVRHPHNNGVVAEELFDEGIGTIGTVGSIPASGATSMAKKTQFSPTGKTTDVKFNDKGQLELNGSDELDDDAVDILQKAGVEVKEAGYVMDPQLVRIIANNKEDVEHFKAGGELSQNLETDLHFHYYDRLSYKAQRDADDEGEIGQLFAEDLGIDFNEGVEVTEAGYQMDPALVKIIAANKEAVERFKAGGELSQDLETALHYHYYDQLSGQAQRDADDDGEIGQLFAEDLGIDFNESVSESVTEPGLKAILDQYSEAYAGFKAGGDLTDSNEFYEALFDYFSNNGEMPYGTQKARDGDPVQWITDKLNELDGHQPMGEADDMEASPADQAGADKNIIMQIRKAKDNEKPTPLQLADGSSVKIDSSIAGKMLQQFDKLKPESKALMQQTLNTEEGFREILNYFNEREITESMSDIDLISNHMKPILVAEARARKLVRGIFGK